jgi:hypothetical protein
MRTRTALLLAGVATALAAAPVRAAPDAAAAWKLAPSDFVRFERKRVTLGKDGKEKLGSADVSTVHGSDLRDGGLYRPETPRREDLPELFAFRLCRLGDASWRIPLADTLDVQFDATFWSDPRPEGNVVQAQWTFASKGRGDGNWLVRDGKATTRTTFDTESVAVASRVVIRYTLVKREPGKGDQPRTVDETWDFQRKDLRHARYDAFYADVNAAIDRGVAHLRTLQKDDGSFEPYGGWEGGTTSLAAYTLLACGVPRDDPQCAKALALVTSKDPARNYELAVGLMAVERAFVEPGNTASEAAAGKEMPAPWRAWCERAAQRLETQSVAPGSWGYPNAGNELYKMDSSNTQYAALGLRAAARLGFPVREQTWLGLIRHFATCREKDAPKAQVSLDGERGSNTSTSAPLDVREAAGFRYRPHEPRAHGSMTCAGIGSLAIARDELRRAKSKRFGAQDEAEVEAMILGGWAWIDAHYAVDRHPLRGGDWYHYWLYSLERAGLLTGVRRVGGKDWYFDGAMELLARQAENGSWDEPGGVHTTETCFALLFLKRATAPAAATTGR